MTDLMSHREPASPTDADDIDRAAPEVLLRLPVDGTDWAEHLPPVPRRLDVSVSFASALARRRHEGALSDLGYRVVDTADHPFPGEYVDVVLRGGAAETAPSWWRALAALAERAYPLALGPAAAMWAGVVAEHQRQASVSSTRGDSG